MSQNLEYIADTSAGAIRDLGVARALLDDIRNGTRGPTLRIYQPQPTVAFGARDRFADGFPQATQAARAHGFTPALRTLGGRAAAYHLGSLVLDHLEPASTLYGKTQERFTQFGELYASALRTLGVDWDPQTGGALSELHPGITVEDVKDAFLAAYATEWDIRETALTSEVIEASRAYDERHRVE